jgi:hypothetical protein
MSRCSNGEEWVRSVFTEVNSRRAMWADEFDGQQQHSEKGGVRDTFISRSPSPRLTHGERRTERR